MLSAVASGTTATVLNAGIYATDFIATIVATGDRAYPVLEIYASADTIGTDNPLAFIQTTYLRDDAADLRIVGGSAHFRVTSDDTVVKFNFTQGGYTTITNPAPSYTINAGAILTFNRLGSRGERGLQGTSDFDLYEDVGSILSTAFE